ncbi:IMS domain-containing protein [Leptolyngbya sp. GB1-A1]
MRIPLDYYRILGLPIQATAEQLQQAHRDRSLQLPPRREFSEAAVAARRQLIDEAYAVLSDPVQRQEYDAGFLAKSYELLEVGRLSPGGAAEQSGGAIDEHNLGSSINGSYRPGDPDLGIDLYTPCIEIDEAQFVGVLLILLELGEYELILKLGRPYVIGGNRSVKQGQFGDPDIISTDILLAVALACLELGREQWNQGQYENAAESLDTGRELLLREGVFAQIRGEMQAELYKLRPYRILELLALPESHVAERRQGLTLLQEMLHDRSGIDGEGADQSGLNTDDFLRFMQQLRSYLTSAEQQALFEVEARRPSPVATYLAVYALVARGFAEGQPALVRRAKTMLIRLGIRQDVHLEQAVCALLLGQTEEASRALELSQEYESLAFIRDHSQGSPDLLPGLCLYSERWLQNEVFPHFRDLARKQASLKEYFADEDVQAYLEELPNEPELSSPWSGGTSYRESPSPGETGTLLRNQSDRSSSAVTMPDRGASDSEVAPAERFTSRPKRYEEQNGARTNGTGRPTRFVDPNPLPAVGNHSAGGAASSRTRQDSPEEPIAAPIAPPSRRPATRKGLRLDRLVFLAAIGLLSLTVLAFLISRLFAGQNDPAPATTDPSPAATVQSNAAPAASQSSPQSSAAGVTEPLTETTAETVLQSWLTAKAAAMGNQHQTGALADILANPLLSQWQTRSEKAKTENWYWQYEHPNVEIVSVTKESGTVNSSAGDNSTTGATSSTASSDSTSDSASSGTSSGTSSGASPTASGSPAGSSDRAASSAAFNSGDERAQVEAIVTERGDLFVNGQIDQSSSYEDSIRARYNLVRSQGQWRIEAIDVLE